MASCLQFYREAKVLAASRCLPLLSQSCSMTKVNLKRPKPRLMERRVLEAITQPILPLQLNDPTRFCSVKLYEKRLKEKKPEDEDKLHLYESFLVREAKKVLEENGMILAVQAESMNNRKQQALDYKIREAGLTPVIYQADILVRAIKDTKWENLSILLHQHTMVIVSKEDKVKEFIKLSKKIPEIVLLGGIVEDRLMTRDGLTRYAEMGDIEGLRAELVHLLGLPASRTRSLLSHHQQTLTVALEQYSKQSSCEQISAENSEKNTGASS